MPLAQFYGPWHCFRPISRHTTAARYSQLFLSINALKQCRRYLVIPNYAQYAPDPNSRSDTFRPRTKYKAATSEKTGKWLRLSDDRAISDLSTEEIYEELRQAAKQCDYGRTKQYVTLLVAGRGEKPSIQLYHAIIMANANSQYGSPSEVGRLLQEMVQEDIPPDASIYHAALKVLSIHPDYLLRQEILQELHRRWFTLTADGWHDIIAGLVRDRQLEAALINLRNVELQGIKIKPWLYDLLIYTLCDISEYDEAFKIMQRRSVSGEAPISPTLWYNLLDGASRSLHYNTVAFVWHTRVEAGYIKPPSGICINVLNTAARHGDTRLATAVFYTLSSRKHIFQLHHYETLLESWLTSNDLKAAFTILSVMLQSRLPPTEGSTRSIYLYLCDDYGRPAEALQILRKLKNEDRPIPHAALNVVLEAYIHYNDLGSALETYKSMHLLIPSGPDTSTFNTLFRGCRHARRKDLAMFLASEMLALNIPPNSLTYDRLILNCLSAQGEPDGGFEDAWRYFEEMKQMGWWPRMGTLKHLGIKGCEMTDRKVWGLVGERGLDEGAMERLMRMHWGKRVGNWKDHEEGLGNDGSRSVDDEVEKMKGG